MTTKSDFTTEEWQLILEAPPSAGMIVVTAQRGGSFRESIAMAKAYVEARKQHGESELLDEIVAAKPERDHTHYHSPDELKQSGLKHLRDSVALLERKSTPVEVDEYRQIHHHAVPQGRICSSGARCGGERVRTGGDQRHRECAERHGRLRSTSKSRLEGGENSTDCRRRDLDGFRTG